MSASMEFELAQNLENLLAHISTNRIDGDKMNRPQIQADTLYGSLSVLS